MPEREWLVALEARLAAAPDACVGGLTVNALPQNAFSTTSQLLIDYLYAYYGSDAGSRPRFFASNNFCVPADAFRSSGGFDAAFRLPAGEDRDFCTRWVEGNRPMIFAPEAVVRHAHPLRLTSFWRQHFRYGRGAYHYHRARARRRQERLQVEPLRFYLDLFRFPLTRLSPTRAIVAAALLFIAQVANVAGFFREKLRPTASG
jgi:GT2 family glycosyltransferase